MKKLFLLFTVVLCASTLKAQDNTFTIDAQLRARGEYRYGVLDPTYTGEIKGTSFINERARLGLGYEHKWISLKFSGQHTGVWGQTSQNPVNSGDFSINEAWANLKFGPGFYTKIGRQTLVYDDERLLGGLDWHVSGRSHDALKLGWISTGNSHQIDVVLAMNRNSIKTSGGDYYDASSTKMYKNMQTFWYHFNTTNKVFGGSLLFINLGFEKGTATDPANRYMQTFGTYLNYKPGIFNIEGAAYYQMGEHKSGKDIAAWMFSLKATANFSKVFSANIGVDALSGDKDGSKYTAFDPLYGTGHKFYGSIDHYYVNRSSTAPAFGLIDPYIGVGVNIAKTLNLSTTYHCFMRQTNGRVQGVEAGYDASEIDFQATWKIYKFITLMGGYSYYGASDSGKTWVSGVKPVNNNTNQHWGWLQLNINPRIFSTKW